jgi:hypothetical protein
MSHLVKHGAFLMVLGLAGLPALAQQHGNQPQRNPNPAQAETPQHMPAPLMSRIRDIDVTQAKEMAHLIRQGQLNLRDATAIAEKQSSGTALEVVCRIEPTTPLTPRMGQTGKPGATRQPGEAKKPVQAAKAGANREKEDTAGRRLVYEVSCLANGKLQTLRVDGLTKKVLEGTQGFPERSQAANVPQPSNTRPRYMPSGR